jgi:cell division protein FtsB
VARSAKKSAVPTAAQAPDMADELARKDLGLIRPDEVSVPLN